jgi:FkbM family methyltransferase
MPTPEVGLGFLTSVRKLARSRAGISTTMQWAGLRFAAKAGLPEPALWHVRPRQVFHPLQARLRGSSDLQVFDQMFIFEEYSVLRELDEPSLVLDLGANVGFSAAYFLSVFPKARIVAVEPDERNVAICRANLAPYGDRVLLLHGAVWSRVATLGLLKGTYGDGREWATQVGELSEEESTSTGVQAWDVGSIIHMSGGGSVDLLKVDIEGAELSVFGESAGSWLHSIRNISIELHGKDCEKVFFAALKDFDYELGHFGELTICRNLRPRKMTQAKPNSP